MAKMNYNRPVHRQIDERKKDWKQLEKKPLGNHPIIHSDKMNFGKYKGFSLSAIPTGYLEWLISVTPEDSQALKYARELAKRPSYVKRLNK